MFYINFMLLDNYVDYKQCPLCADSHIGKTGIIERHHPLYSSTEVEFKYRRELWKCQACHSGFIQNIIEESLSDDIYSRSDGNIRWKETSGFKESKTKDVLFTLSKHFRDTAKVLDIGCNTGELLDFAKNFGCVTYGIEYSTSSREISALKGHNMLQYVDIGGGQKFDVITVFDVIEHLYDVKGFLELCHGALAENGKLILMTGNINSISARFCGEKWWYVSAPEHIVFPSRDFFIGLHDWKLVKWESCYNSKAFICSRWQLVKSTILPVLKKTYSAYFSLTPDHALIVLEKSKLD